MYSCCRILMKHTQMSRGKVVNLSPRRLFVHCLLLSIGLFTTGLCQNFTIHFTLAGETYLNNSAVDISDIGEGKNSLLCVTDNRNCCKLSDGLITIRQGMFYFPDESRVRRRLEGGSMYSNRGPRIVRLQRSNNARSPTGVYRCEIPDYSGINQSIYINITDGNMTRDILIGISMSVMAVMAVMAVAVTSIICACWWRRRFKRVVREQSTTATSRKLESEDHDAEKNRMFEANSFSNEPENRYVISNTDIEMPPLPILPPRPTTLTDGMEEDGYAAITDELTTGDQEKGYQSITMLDINAGSPPPDNHGHSSLKTNENTEADIDGYEHEYQEPFIEPATKEEELFVQIVELKIANILEEDVEILEYLGSGQFGTVNKAKLKQKDENGADVISEVAVKSMTEMSSDEDKIKFLQEAAIMGQFHHCNILRIQGIIMDGGAFKIVIDLMHNGDLHGHLLSLRNPNLGYELCEIKQMLMSFTRQVGCGLGYLSSREYVHRDLAARNVLISADGICKIADFGLSRDLQHENYYRSHGGKIPVKWTAPEALNYRKYSTASDVWSYGCLLYEIWSLGEKPYRHLTNAETMRAISNGYRLAPPPGCPKPIYKIMIDCWHPAPEERPRPPVIVSGLQRPDFVYVKWSPEEMNLYSEESRTLGMELDKGQCLHRDLQRMYFTPSNDGSVKTGNMVREAVKVDKGSMHNDTVIKEEGNKGQLEAAEDIPSSFDTPLNKIDDADDDGYD